MYRELLLCAFCCQVSHKFFACVLSPSIAVQALDLNPFLHQDVRLELLVLFEDLAFGSHEVNSRKTGVVVCKRNIVTLLPQALGSSRPPNIRVDDIAEGFRVIALLYFRDAFLCRLGLDARFASGSRLGGELNSLDDAVFDHVADCFMGYVARASRRVTFTDILPYLWPCLIRSSWPSVYVEHCIRVT